MKAKQQNWKDIKISLGGKKIENISDISYIENFDREALEVFINENPTDKDILMPLVKLRYDIRTAYEDGYTSHPMVVMDTLGFKVRTFEGVPIADCVILGVETATDPLPSFLERIN